MKKLARETDPTAPIPKDQQLFKCSVPECGAFGRLPDRVGGMCARCARGEPIEPKKWEGAVVDVDEQEDAPRTDEPGPSMFDGQEIQCFSDIDMDEGGEPLFELVRTHVDIPAFVEALGNDHAIENCRHEYAVFDADGCVQAALTADVPGAEPVTVAYFDDMPELRSELPADEPTKEEDPK